LGKHCNACDEDIEWGGIQTDQGNYRIGLCACREWREEDHGGRNQSDWVLVGVEDLPEAEEADEGAPCPLGGYHEDSLSDHEMRGFSHCVAGENCVPASHGGTSHKEICECGATRVVNSTGGEHRTEYGPWVEPEE
jgi:hypothetical protein